tara:strand:+ start:2852 stop:3064 length:213 start_codon:yes stop_codon:yes gene_type:complete
MKNNPAIIAAKNLIFSTGKAFQIASAATYKIQQKSQRLEACECAKIARQNYDAAHENYVAVCDAECAKLA